jgi:hypothetical protein
MTVSGDRSVPLDFLFRLTGWPTSLCDRTRRLITNGLSDGLKDDIPISLKMPDEPR